jgi:hypothetical protein
VAVNCGTNDALSIDSTPITGYPFSLACWFWAPDLAVGHVLMWVGNKGSGSEFADLLIANAGGANRVRALKVTGGVAPGASSPNIWTASQWQFAGGVWVDENTRYVYHQDTSGFDNTPSGTSPPNGWDRIGLGASLDQSPFYSNYKRIALAAAWNRALSASEMLELYRRRDPMLIRRGLVACWPLGGVHPLSGNDIVGDYNLADVGTPTWEENPPGTMWAAPCLTPLSRGEVSSSSSSRSSRSETSSESSPSSVSGGVIDYPYTSVVV